MQLQSTKQGGSGELQHIASWNWNSGRWDHQWCCDRIKLNNQLVRQVTMQWFVLVLLQTAGLIFYYCFSITDQWLVTTKDVHNSLVRMDAWGATKRNEWWVGENCRKGSIETIEAIEWGEKRSSLLILTWDKEWTHCTTNVAAKQGEGSPEQ